MNVFGGAVGEHEQICRKTKNDQKFCTGLSGVRSLAPMTMLHCALSGFTQRLHCVSVSAALSSIHLCGTGEVDSIIAVNAVMCRRGPLNNTEH